MIKQINYTRITVMRLIIILTFLLSSQSIYAEAVREIVLIGATLDLKLQSRLAGKKGDLDRKDIEAIGVLITDEYHNRGYTTSFVEKYVLKKDGVLEIYVKESKIAGVSISGVSKDEAAEIEHILVPETGEVYNKFFLKGRMKEAREQLNLELIKIYPQNYEDSGDVFLAVEVTKRKTGLFSGQIGIDPIYGVMPELGYFFPMGNSSLNIQARAGIKGGELRKIEGETRYIKYIDKNKVINLLFGLQGGRSVEIWETHDSKYAVNSVAPYAGLGFIFDFFSNYIIWTNLYLKESINYIQDYKEEKATSTESDTALIADILISNKYYLLDKKDATELNIFVSGGKSNLESRGYIITFARFNTSFLPVSWLRFSPRLNIYYTTSKERYYWQYVYDKNLMGFSDDYTASRFKNILGLESEAEILTGSFYMGPLINYGYFLNEDQKWNSKTGIGLKGRYVYKDTTVQLIYAWDASRSITKGGIYLYIESSF